MWIRFLHIQYKLLFLIFVFCIHFDLYKKNWTDRATLQTNIDNNNRCVNFGVSTKLWLVILKDMVAGTLFQSWMATFHLKSIRKGTPKTLSYLNQTTILIIVILLFSSKKNAWLW